MHSMSARCRPWTRRSGHVRLSHGRSRTTRYGTRQSAVMSSGMHRQQRCHHHRRRHRLRCRSNRRNCRRCRRCPTAASSHSSPCPTAASSHSSPTERLTKLPPRGPQAVRAHRRLGAYASAHHGARAPPPPFRYVRMANAYTSRRARERLARTSPRGRQHRVRMQVPTTAPPPLRTSKERSSA